MTIAYTCDTKHVLHEARAVSGCNNPYRFINFFANLQEMNQQLCFFLENEDPKVLYRKSGSVTFFLLSVSTAMQNFIKICMVVSEENRPLPSRETDFIGPCPTIVGGPISIDKR